MPQARPQQVRLPEIGKSLAVDAALAAGDLQGDGGGHFSPLAFRHLKIGQLFFQLADGKLFHLPEGLQLLQIIRGGPPGAMTAQRV